MGVTWRKLQPSGVWASFSDVGMWGDMFLLFLELDRERRRRCSPPRNQFPSRGLFLSHPLLPKSAEALSYEPRTAL